MFYYSRDRSGEHPRAHLEEYAGIFQFDAYGGYTKHLLTGEDMLNRRVHHGFAAIGSGSMPGHRFAFRLLAVDLRAQETAGEESLIGAGAIGGVGPDVAGGVVLVEVSQQRAIVARRISNGPAADPARR